jgi:hypothetical protein
MTRLNPNWLPPNAAQPPTPLSLPDWLGVLSDELQFAAVDRRAQHVADVGFPAESALKAVAELERHDLAILGSDVWTERHEREPEIFPSLGWATSRRGPQERWNAYVRRVAALALDRIRSVSVYAHDEGWGSLLFALVSCDEQRSEPLMAMDQKRKGTQGR